MEKQFKLHSSFSPTGDQPQAIKSLTEGILKGNRAQSLIGVTGSGKTFTMANVIANVQKPTIVLSHNKVLAAQLCSEFKEFFPENAVEYFISYYDYYQPEAYVPGKDLYIEKDALINDEIDRLRHSATSSLFERRDVIIVASVSCIYSLGDPSEYKNLMLYLREGMEIPMDRVIYKLVSINYNRNDLVLERDKFRVRGDTIEIMPASGTTVIKVEFFGDEIDRITEVDALSGKTIRNMGFATIYPASHYATSQEKKYAALAEIEKEKEERVAYFKSQNRLIEAQRIEERTNYDMEMIREIGYCNGVENYSRILSGRPEGSTPFCLLDYFPDDYIMFIDESHVTLPQIHAMSGGDHSRKENLIEYGFRLPSAFDNRPLKFDEFKKKLNQVIYVSATPGQYEKDESENIVEQLIRPTGLLDPQVIIRPIATQVDDVLSEIKERSKRNERTLVTTLTIRMAEDLCEYLEKNNVKVRYIHHEIQAIERQELIRDLRLGVYDCLVGINLLREGLDIPEVSLVAILDADKEGLLRSKTSLIQTIGRAARNEHGTVIMYADVMTDSIQTAVNETNRRRKIQEEYNLKHGISPHTIIKEVRNIIEITAKNDIEKAKQREKMSNTEREKLISELTKEMKEAAANLDFERAAYLRDTIATISKVKENG